MGLVIPAEMGRLEGGIGVAIEHETGAADGQQDALITGKFGEGARRLDGGRAKPVVKVELLQARARGEIRIWAVVPCLFSGHLQLVRLFNQGDHVGASARSGERGASDTISGSGSQGGVSGGRAGWPQIRQWDP